MKQPKYKPCSKCRWHKPLDRFHKNKRSKDGHCNYCKSCISKYDKVRKKNNPEKHNEQARRWRKANPEKISRANKRANQKRRKEVIDAYGGKCSCCGETHVSFLTIDHMNNDGAAHRRAIGPGYAIYIWLKKNDFPKQFQLLCWNCNCGRDKNGGICPHKQT